MSEGYTIAIIGFIGSVLAGVIGALATMWVGGSGSSQQSGRSYFTVGIVTIVMGVVGLVCGVLFGTFITQLSNNNASTVNQDNNSITSVPTMILSPFVVAATSPTAVLNDPERTVDDAVSAGKCGPDAFDGNIAAANPTFVRPAGHTSGWISTSQAKVTLPNGMFKEFDSGFVLVVEDLPSIQLENVVTRNDGGTNTWGCWFLSSDSGFVMESAMRDHENKRLNETNALLIRATSSGFEQILPAP